MLELHHFLEITAITELHEYVVSRFCLDGLAHCYDILALYCILILNFADDELLATLVEVLTLYNFAGIKLGVL